jgi:hypothetical protein
MVEYHAQIPPTRLSSNGKSVIEPTWKVSRVGPTGFGDHVGGQVDAHCVKAVVAEHPRRRFGATTDVGDQTVTVEAH